MFYLRLIGCYDRPLLVLDFFITWFIVRHDRTIPPDKNWEKKKLVHSFFFFPLVEIRSFPTHTLVSFISYIFILSPLLSGRVLAFHPLICSIGRVYTHIPIPPPPFFFPSIDMEYLFMLRSTALPLSINMLIVNFSYTSNHFRSCQMSNLISD